MRVILFCLVLIQGQALANEFGTTPERLTLDAFEQTFEEEFDSLDVSARGYDSKWIAHTPWAGDFGDAKFMDPGRDGPFSVSDGVLTIQASKSKRGRWESGLLSAVDGRKNGFHQKHGYFEARLRFSYGDGIWPAFWLVGVDRSDHVAEIDVLEFYGHDSSHYKARTHVWIPGDRRASRHQNFDIPLDPQQFEERFQRVGVLIRPDAIAFYLNGVRVAQAEPLPALVNASYFPLVNLALGSGWPIDRTPNPSHLYVDYIRVYRERST